MFTRGAVFVGEGLRTRDLELCLEGATKGAELAGASFSMEWRRREAAGWRLSGSGVADTGRNAGGAAKKQKKRV